MTYVALGDVTRNLDAKRVPVRSSSRQPGPYPYYGASGIVDWVSDFLFEGRHLLVAEDGENLRSRNTPVAFLADGKFWVNNHAHVLTAVPGISDIRYLCYQLQLTDMTGYLTGSAQPKLNRSALDSIQVWLPDLATQTAIADVLGALDDKIAANERLASVSMELALASFERAVRDLPQVAISELSTAVLGGTPDRGIPRYWGGGIAWVSVADVTKAAHGYLISTEESISVEATQKTRARVVPAGSTIVTARGTVGKLARTGFDGAFNQSCYAFVPGAVPSHLLFFALAAGMLQAQAHSHGTVFQTITMRTFDHLTVPDVRLAPASLEDALALIVGRADSALRENRVLAATRDAFLPELMSGRLAVNNI
ncbi:hypothetical protein TESS_TESS_01121 [Tessaracoccus sp. O5.2]|uniref:restriction endonuclease subunit S n=1 Tax=Tessaracoccus sp. O5.2 TaxID=3157622 RepID=UPI0035E4C0FA